MEKDNHKKNGKEFSLGTKVLGLLIYFTGTLGVVFVIAEIFSRTVLDSGMNYDLEMWKYAKLIKQESNIPEDIAGSDLECLFFLLEDEDDEENNPKPGLTKVPRDEKVKKIK